MTNEPSKTSIAIVQLTSDDSLNNNINSVGQRIDKSVKNGAKIIFLPENSFYMRREAHHKDSAEFEGSPSPKCTTKEHPGIIAAQGWARQYKVWIVIGSIAPTEPEADLPYNRSVVIDADGNIASHYDKIHLFDVELGGGETYAESARIAPGDQAVVANTPWGGLGLTICYDIRFPHLYTDLARAGADLISIPAAFTVPTGKAHWHVLQRARAIETGAFVISAAQCGEHPGGRLSYGHSLVVNPWGEVLCDLGEEPGYKVLEIDLAEVAKARSTIPNLKNRRDYRLAVSK